MKLKEGVAKANYGVKKEESREVERLTLYVPHFL